MPDIRCLKKNTRFLFLSVTLTLDNHRNSESSAMPWYESVCFISRGCWRSAAVVRSYHYRWSWMDHRYGPHISPSLIIPLWPLPQLLCLSSLWLENDTIPHTRTSPCRLHIYSILVIIWPSISIEKFVSRVYCPIGHMPKGCSNPVHVTSQEAPVFSPDLCSTYRLFSWWGRFSITVTCYLLVSI